MPDAEAATNELCPIRNEANCDGRPGAVDRRYGISKLSGVVASVAAISVAALPLLAAVFTVFPAAKDEVIGVLTAAIIIPVIALFKPLQEVTVFTDGLGFSTIFSNRMSRLHWTDVTDVRLRRDVLGVTNLEFKKNDRKIYQKIPLSVIPERRELLRHVLESFPSDHPKRGVVEPSSGRIRDSGCRASSALRLNRRLT